MRRPISAVHDSVYRLRIALDDLERATAERNLKVARYLLDTEVMEAMASIRRAKLIDDDLLEHLMGAVESVHEQLWRHPR